MTRQEAIEFLKQHQPLPADENLSREVIDTYDEVRKYFVANPDSEAVPLLLNSFGQGSGFGVYQLVEDVLAKLPKEAVIPHLARGLGSHQHGVRYWNAQIAARCPDPRLVPHLANLLQEPDHDLRFAVVTALEQIADDSALDVLRGALESETDEELRGLLLDVLAEKSAE